VVDRIAIARNHPKAEAIVIIVAVVNPVVFGSIFSTLTLTPAQRRAPGVFHCTTGKSRGWAGAALLTLLGVPKETVTADYRVTAARL
jgi:hypothetical protein